MRALLGFQARLNRDIGRHLRAMREGDSPTAVIAGVAFAFLYGVLHTLGPGHGKFAVSSYFLAREARLWRGILMGAQIGLTHVISAVVLMLVADVSIRHLLGGPPAEFLWVRLLGCSATGVVGLLILWGAVRGARPSDDGHGHSHAGCHHGSDNRRQGLLALGVGLVPCTGALLVMLYAMANDMLVTGILMTAAIAAGMAATMSGLGILTILARQTVLRWVETGGQKPGRARRVLEIGGAAVLVAFSAVMLIGTF
jgi:ABC-type nickel/cobalt efflux system permease component RcnA